MCFYSVYFYRGVNQPSSYSIQPLYPSYIGIIYGILAGIIGSQCVLELKELSAIVKVCSKTC